MRKDQIFVLMLVILLPMSGCFDGAIGEAEAEDSDNDSIEVSEQYDGVYTLRVAPDTSETISVNNSTILVEELHTKGTEGWRQEGNIDYSITCDNGDEIASRFYLNYNYHSLFLPVTGENCDVTIGADYASIDIVMIYRLVPNTIV